MSKSPGKVKRKTSRRVVFNGREPTTRVRRDVEVVVFIVVSWEGSIKSFQVTGSIVTRRSLGPLPGLPG
jgi:hypothetical protein